jgi:hypothetical protein
MRRTLSRPAPASRSEAALLQRSNRAAPPLVAPRFAHNFSNVPIRAKLKLGAAGDAFEREADRVAEQVMKTPESRVQRACACGGSCGDCSKDDEPPQLRRKSIPGAEVTAPDSVDDLLRGAASPGVRVQADPGVAESAPSLAARAYSVGDIVFGAGEYRPLKRVQVSDNEQTAAPPLVHEVLAGPGQHLDRSTRRFMEPRFGHDFSQVRVYTDAKAAESARALNALAYTVGRNVVFDAGQYQPGMPAGRQLLAHELSHTIQQGAVNPQQAELGRGEAAAPITNTADLAVQRAMKFELQTSNVIWRTSGTHRKELPRKFGPDKIPKHKDFLHKGTKGKPPKGTEEGTAIELQSEAHGFVEFETPSWQRHWCKIKEPIQEAVDMVDTIDKSKVVSTTGGVKTVEFPFDVKHLAKTKDFPKGLKTGEKLEVEIQDPTWSAKIQASESFELPQFESYLKEHMSTARFKSITGSAKKILTAANKAKLPDKDLVNLHSLLQMIIETITEARLWNPALSGHLAKEHISLMSRTNFSSMFKMLSKNEQKLFEDIVSSGTVLTELGVTDKTLVYPLGFKGIKSPGPTIHHWLVSIHAQQRDLLSSLGGDNRAMGRFDVDTTSGKKDTNLVKFEARSTSGHDQNRPAVDQKDKKGVVVKGGWVAFAEEVFKAAHINRPRKGSTELIYDPKKCP